MVAISENKLVKLHYKGTLDDGSVFDSSEGRDALEFISGTGMIIPGLDKGIKGLKAGDKKQVKIESKDAYGPRMDEALQEVPKDQFPKDIELKVGMQLAAQGPQGTIPVVITEINADTVKVDFNHPLAGKDLTFDVEIVEVKDATEEDKAKFMPQNHEHAEGGCCGSSCGDNGDCSDSSCSDGSCSNK